MNRKIKMIYFKSLKSAISVISLFNHRIYMKLYIPLLKTMGMIFNGKPRYIGKDVKFDKFQNIELGDRVVISNHCLFLTHDYSITTALISIGEKPKTDIALERNIKVGDNVFIGTRSIIMPNTTIGNNVIVGAGSVIRGIIPDNSIIIGNPGTIIGNIQDQAKKWEKYLFTDQIRID